MRKLLFISFLVLTFSTNAAITEIDRIVAVVNEDVILELKAVKQLMEEHSAQLLYYLKANSIEVGLLLNFGSKAQHVRKVYGNERKGSLNWVQSK